MTRWVYVCVYIMFYIIIFVSIKMFNGSMQTIPKRAIYYFTPVV